jgi:MFS family permease
MKSARPLIALLPFWMFCILFKFSGALHYTLLPVLGERVFPVWVAGLLIGGGAFLQMLMDVPAGYLLDRFGYVRVLLWSTLGFFCAAAVLLFGIHPWTVIVSIIFATVGWLFFGPGVDAYVLVKADARIAGQYMAMRDMMDSAGVVIGMIFLPFAIHLPSGWLAVLLGLPLLASIVALVLAPRDTASVHAEKKIGHQSFYIRRRFIHHVFMAIREFNPVSTLLLLQNVSSAAFYGIVWFVIPLLIATGDHARTLDFGLMVFDGSVLVTGFFIGKLTDHWDKRWMVFCGLLLFAVCAALLGFNLSVLFIMLGFLATTGDSMASISLWAWLDVLDKKHSEDALVSGAITLFQDIGWTIGPVIGGLLFGLVGASWTILTGSLLIFSTWVISSLLLSHTHVTVGSLPPRSRLRDPLPRHKPHKR